MSATQERRSLLFGQIDAGSILGTIESIACNAMPPRRTERTDRSALTRREPRCLVCLLTNCDEHDFEKLATMTGKPREMSAGIGDPVRCGYPATQVVAQERADSFWQHPPTLPLCGAVDRDAPIFHPSTSRVDRRRAKTDVIAVANIGLRGAASIP